MLSTMNDDGKLSLMSQIVDIMIELSKQWEKIQPQDNLHFTNFQSLIKMNDGHVYLTQSSITSQSKEKTTFWNLMSQLFPNDLSLRSHYDDPSFECCRSLLIDYATQRYRAEDYLKNKWSSYFQNLEVDSQVFIHSFSSDIPEICIRPILVILNCQHTGEETLPSTVSYRMFCESGLIYGKWWEGIMRKALINVTSSNGHFFITTSRNARQHLRSVPYLKYIIRPRSKFDNPNRNVLWPFAITLLNSRNSFEDYVVSFDVMTNTFYINHSKGRLNGVGSDLFGLCNYFVTNIL